MPLTLLSLLIVTGGAAWIGPTPKGSMPAAEARQVIDAARRSLTTGGAESAAAELDVLARAAEEVTAREAHRPFWHRREGSALVAWERVHTAAIAALVELRRERLAGRHRWTVDEAATLRALDTASAVARRRGLDRREARLLTLAEQELNRARRLAAAGDYAAASLAAVSALEKTTQLEDHQHQLHARFQDPAALRQWRRQVAETLAASARSGRSAVVVDKYHRLLLLYKGGRQIASFPAELGLHGLERKLFAGDRATPEGHYRVREARKNGATRYYKALLLDYPNAEDRRRYNEERKAGRVPRGAGIGSLIEIHGHGGRGSDWTDGCVALADRDMDRLFAHAPVGTPITIVGRVPDHVP